MYAFLICLSLPLCVRAPLALSARHFTLSSPPNGQQIPVHRGTAVGWLLPVCAGSLLTRPLIQTTDLPIGYRAPSVVAE